MSFVDFQEAVLIVAGALLLWLGAFWLAVVILLAMLLIVLALVRRAFRLF